MKFLFYALIIVNIAFFSWQYQKQLDGTQSDSISEKLDNGQVPSLVLLSERAQTDDDSVVVVNDAVPKEEIKKKELESDCYQVGPFKKQADLDYAIQELKDKGIQVNESRTEKRVLEGWLVYLSEDYSLLAARERMKELREVGVHDISVVRSENNNFIISLGFFSSEGIAEERLIHITGLGYEPKVKTHDKHYEIFMLDVTRQNASEPRPWELISLTDELTGVKYTKIECK